MQPEDATVAAGANVTLGVTARGTPPPQVHQWVTALDEPLPSGNGDNVITIQNVRRTADFAVNVLDRALTAAGT